MIIFNTLKDMKEMKSFYIFPIIAYAKQNSNKKEEGIYLGWLCWLIFFSLNED